MTDELSPGEALALWGLLARQGRARAAEVRKPDRDALIAAGFAEADAPAKTVSLTDRGWRWASEHLDAPALDRQPVLSLLLARLGAYIATGDVTLASLIGQAPPLAKPGAKPGKPKPPKAGELRKLIEDAYLRITEGKFDEAVNLSQLREELAHHTRKTVDSGLRRISKAKRERARLGQINDSKSIAATERDAAFVSESTETFHIIWIRP